MMIGDTHWLLKRFREEHYLIEQGADNSGRACWNVYYPQGSRSAPGGVYSRDDAYAGTVQSFNPGPHRIKRTDIYLCFGRPTFFFNESLAKSDVEKEVKRIVNSSPRAKFVPKKV